jgi:N-methylhydantoinase B/oxoprolinase/acetone carboxylase alpha subunit
MGAGAESDGVSSCMYPASSSKIPVELFEVAVPLIVGETELVTDSGGAGRHRGGLGHRVSLRLHPKFKGVATLSFEPHAQNIPPFGLNGGTAAHTAEIMIDGRILSPMERLAQTGAFHLDTPDLLISLASAGGGGFNRPEQRDPQSVQMDVRNGLVSPEKALHTYGVVLDPSTFVVNAEATNIRRQELSAVSQSIRKNPNELPSQRSNHVTE